MYVFTTLDLILCFVTAAAVGASILGATILTVQSIKDQREGRRIMERRCRPNMRLDEQEEAIQEAVKLANS